MAETVYFKDGAMDTVLPVTDEWFYNTLSEKLGPDVARYFEECYCGEPENICEDCWRMQEESEDHYSALCQEALETFARLQCELEKSRINKDHISRLIKEGYETLYKNL